MACSWNSYPSCKLVVDGDFGRYTIYALQYNLKYKWDGGLYRHSSDGKWGYYTAFALQNYLKNRGYYKGRLDGDAKAMTWSALQNYIQKTFGPMGHLQPESWNWPDPRGLGLTIQFWLNKVR